MSNEQDSNTIIEKLLDDRLDAVQGAMKADVLTYLGPITPPIDDEIKFAVEELDPRSAKLIVILETSGGYMETAERMAGVFRFHYDQVEFLVPSFAMSAGTILVMSGDAIHMDYASTLGPIDPQVRRAGAGNFVPALGYLEMYDRLIEKANHGAITTAETNYLVRNFDPAELYQYEQERDLSIALLTDWLVQFKFKNWKKTETKGQKVTKAMRTERAEAIARELNKTDRWHSHNRGITMAVLRRDLNLLIDDFGEDPGLRTAVREYYRLLKDYMVRRGHYSIALHTHGTYQGF
jgi:membrane-bound ClpP family serine protease